MPVTGRKPKPEGQKRNRVKPVYDWVEVKDVPFSEPHKLAPCPRWLGRWPEATKRWWKLISTMPHCVLWSESDWSFAQDTALVAARFHEGDMRAAAELRNREKVLGTTVDYRRDLRIRYVSEVEDDEASPATVTQMDRYRQQMAELADES
jgi:hypothetical protein